MADNVNVTAGTGTVIATDQVGTDHYQKIKLTDGLADSSTMIGAGGGVEATALRVTIANDSTGLVSVDDNAGSLTVDGTFWQATQPVSAASLPLPTGAATSALQLPDGHNVTVDNAAGAAAVNIQDGGNAITVDGTVDTELTTADLDIGVGTDTRAVVGLVGSASGGGQIIPGSSTDGLLVNLGTNNDVTVTSISAGNNNIGDVDVASIAAGDNNIGNVDIITVPAPLNVVGTGTEAAAMRVTLASDSTGLVSVDDNAGSLTVDNAALAVVGGGVEATALRVTIASDSTGVVSVDDNGANISVDWGGTVPPIGAGTEAAALRVTLATDSTGLVSVDDNGGALTVDGTVTASNAAGDVAHDSADGGNPVKVGGKAYNHDGSAPGTAVVEADRANFITDVYGRQFVETSHPNLWSVAVNYTVAQTNAEIKAAPGAGLSLFITDVVVSNGATAGNIKFVEATGAAVDKIEVMYFAINGGAVLPFVTPIKLTANTNFGITSVTCTTHSVTVNGFIAP